MTKKYSFIDEGSVTSPMGFKATGVTAGFKRSGAPDFALVKSDKPANYAGAFTSCLFAAAPVRICQARVLKSEKISAVVVNSGNANACTGQIGLENALKTCDLVAEALNISAEEVMVSSTGRIGVQLNMDTIARGIALAKENLSDTGGNLAAKAIMTTDTYPKSVAVKVKIGGKKVTIGGMTKGAGMIDPHMKVLHATMLCYLTTDAKVENNLLAEMLENSVQHSFNRITIDGDMSTNDTTVIMANGESGVEIVANSEEVKIFEEALSAVTQKLAREMVLDGEGATKFVTITIKNAKSIDDARKSAEAVANSQLCKTAWFGNDPNWGRVVAALGYSGADFDSDKTDVYYNDTPVVVQGGSAGTKEEDLADIIKQKEFAIVVDFNDGDADYWVWTCDLSYDYVKINADYHT